MFQKLCAIAKREERLRKHGAEQQSADRDAPPPTPGELRWLKENLIKHQQSVEKLIRLVEALLETASEYADADRGEGE